MSEGQPYDSEDRRRSFRLDDQVHFSYKLLKEDEEGSGEISPIAQLRELSQQGSHILASIRKSEPEIAQYLALLDKKIEIIAQMEEKKRLGDETKPNLRINLSQHGLSFRQKKPLAEGARLQVKMIFFPSLLSIECVGRVVYCNAQEGSSYKVGVEFTNIDERQQEALIRYMIEKQSALLRKERGRE